MPRFKQTARRGGLLGLNNSSRGVATNDMDRGVSAIDDALYPLPGELIHFISQNETTCEPPRKRQKITTQQSSGEGQENIHIIVKQSTWDIKCAGPSRLNGRPCLVRDNINLRVGWRRGYGSRHHLDNLDFVEILDDKKGPLFHAALPIDKTGLKNAIIAMRANAESEKWTKGGQSKQGNLWSEFSVSLFEKDHSDYVQITFTVKWNITRSPYEVPRVANKTRSLKDVLDAYFPDANAEAPEAWSPQDFYQSVHTPDKGDESAASLPTPELESGLYPFQKRAVQWLLRREGVEWSAESRKIQQSSKSGTADLPISFIKAVDARGRQCFISHLFGIVTLDIGPFQDMDRNLLGGILAEEMGLGKTLEIISLVTLHKRPSQPPTVFDIFTAERVRPTSATLIVSPPSILQQWISEINRHAPHLKVIHYEGIKAHKKMTPSALVDLLATSDIVISTYSILADEIHYTQLNPEKTLRKESKYPRPKSPLMQLSWWRVCIDEAQMIESGVSNAAVVARMIPRINAWAITGTPVRKDVNDLLGLLIFLRCEPYASAKHVWTSLISSHKPEFCKLFGHMALRHSKRSVRDELKLPAQRRYVITMPFTPIEEQHYQELFNQMCEETGLDAEGAPLIDEWDPASVADIMRKWLVRLRQTALHPEVGGRNRRALGNKEGPLRTVDQVLEVMMENTDLSIRTDQRTILTSKLRRGQLFENSPRVKEALEIWNGVAAEAAEIVKECREQLQQEMAGEGIPSSGKGSRAVSDADVDIVDGQDE
jgi:E3 ubiquitin-protein ligase SHPRH